MSCTFGFCTKVIVVSRSVLLPQARRPHITTISQLTPFLNLQAQYFRDAFLRDGPIELVPRSPIASSAAESAYGTSSVTRQENPPMFAAWRAEGSAVNFAAAYGTDEMLLGGADDVRTLQGTTARSARWKGFLSVGALFCCFQQFNFFVKRNQSL